MAMWRLMNLQWVLLDKVGTSTLVLTGTEELGTHSIWLFCVEVA